MWIATENGISLADQTFHVWGTRYFHEGLHPASGEPELHLSSSPKPVNQFVVLEKELEIKNKKAYADAVARLSNASKNAFNFHNIYSKCCVAAESTPAQNLTFFPEEMNALVPFLLEAAQSEKETVRKDAVQLLCMFNDPRVIDFMAGTNAAGSANCQAKLRKLGLLKGP